MNKSQHQAFKMGSSHKTGKMQLLPVGLCAKSVNKLHHWGQMHFQGPGVTSSDLLYNHHCSDFSCIIHKECFVLALWCTTL